MIMAIPRSKMPCKVPSKKERSETLVFCELGAVRMHAFSDGLECRLHGLRPRVKSR